MEQNGTDHGRQGQADWEALVAAVRADQPRALAALISATAPIVWAAVSGVGSQDDQHDAAHDASEQIIAKLDQLRDPRCYPGWVKTLARREALKYVGRPAWSPLPASLATTCAPVDQDIVDRLSAVPAIGSALGELTDRQRTVVFALMSPDFQDYSTTAEQLGFPIGSLGPTRQRALERMRT